MYLKQYYSCIVVDSSRPQKKYTISIATAVFIMMSGHHLSIQNRAVAIKAMYYFRNLELLTTRVSIAPERLSTLQKQFFNSIVLKHCIIWHI